MVQQPHRLSIGIPDAQQGQAIVWFAVMLPLFFSIIGLAIDAGMAFDSRRELQNVADGAARAGAMQIDRQVYRASSGATIVLDTDSARQVAASYVVSQAAQLSPEVTVSPRRVTVTVRQTVLTSFLRIFGLSSVQISATATAAVQHGIIEGSPS